jgi:ketosteroid isomerase-like protein
MRTLIKLILTILAFALATSNKLNASPEEDAKTVAALDTKYQAAVKANDAVTMDQILADDFVLVTGRGKVFSKADLLDSARKKEVIYERQDEEPGSQKVRVWGDTAVVTALLWIKSVQGGKPADYKLWFSDTYVRTPTAGATSLARLPYPCPKGSACVSACWLRCHDISRVVWLRKEFVPGRYVLRCEMPVTNTNLNHADVGMVREIEIKE